jgi:hypothetical protein
MKKVNQMALALKLIWVLMFASIVFARPVIQPTTPEDGDWIVNQTSFDFIFYSNRDVTSHGYARFSNESGVFTSWSGCNNPDYSAPNKFICHTGLSSWRINRNYTAQYNISHENFGYNYTEVQFVYSDRNPPIRMPKARTGILSPVDGSELAWNSDIRLTVNYSFFVDYDSKYGGMHYDNVSWRIETESGSPVTSWAVIPFDEFMGFSTRHWIPNGSSAHDGSHYARIKFYTNLGENSTVADQFWITGEPEAPPAPSGYSAKYEQNDFPSLVVDFVGEALVAVMAAVFIVMVGIILALVFQFMGKTGALLRK